MTSKKNIKLTIVPGRILSTPVVSIKYIRHTITLTKPAPHTY